MRFTIMLLLLGGFLFYYGVSEVTPEKNLKLIQGVPTDPKVWYEKADEDTIDSVTFSVQKTKVIYKASDDHFKEILALAQAQKPMKVWIPPDDGESIDGNMPIYKLMVNNKTVLSYQEKFEERKSSKQTLFWMSVVMLAFGILRVVMSRRSGNSAVRR